MATVVEYIVKIRDSLSPALTKINSKVQQVDNSISTLGTAISAIAVTRGMSNLINSWDKQEQAVAQVRQGIQSTGAVAGRTLAQLEAQASKLQQKTIFGDEEILKGVTAQLLTFTNITRDQFDKAQTAVLDVTTRLYGADASAESLRSTAIMLGKALNDPVANLGALSRSGIQFSDQQKTLIKQLYNSGRAAEAQNMILQELEKQYGGSAEAAAKAGAGGLKQLQNTMGDIKEMIGGALMPVIQMFAKVLRRMAAWVQKNEKFVKAIIPPLAAFTGTILALIIAIKAWAAIQRVINALLIANPIGLVIAAVAGLAAGIYTLWQESEKFRGTIKGVWEWLKAVGSFIKDSLMAIINGFRDGIKGIVGIFEKLKNIFSSGGKKAAKAYREAYADELKKTAMSPGMKAAGAIGTQAGFAGATGTEGLGETKVSGAAPKMYNITIHTLKGIENFFNQKTTVRENSENIASAVTEALLNGLADVQLTAR